MNLEIASTTFAALRSAKGWFTCQTTDAKRNTRKTIGEEKESLS
jgi:hypothetical protein